MIRGIIFDCFGVLYSGSLSMLASLAATPEARQEVYDVNLRKDYGYIAYTEYLQQTAAAIGRTPQDVDDIIRKKHARNTELVAYLRELRGAGYKIGLLSNMGEETYNSLFPDGDELFDEVLLSYREGVVKPNPAIYEMIASRLGLPIGECVMIDDLDANCEGAEVAGMESVQHITNERTREEISRLLQKA